jgi:hypothetical protein
VFVGSGYRAGAFEAEAAYPPVSPPTVNGTTPCYHGELQRDDIPVPEVLRAHWGPSRAAGPLGEGTSANQIGTDVVWPKHGGPHRPRPAAFASCSAAAISSARAEGWP